MIGILSTLFVTGVALLEAGLTITPIQPIQGEIFRVSYNSRVDGVSLTNPQELALIYLIESKDTVAINAVLMDEEDSVWTYLIRIPENAYFMRFKLEDSLGRPLDNEKRWYNLPVYIREGGVPPNGHLAMGRCLFLLEPPDYEGARSKFERELESYPWNWDAYRGLWDVEMGLTDSMETVRDGIIEQLDSFLKNASDSISLLYETAIRTYAELNEVARARDLFALLQEDFVDEDRFGRAANALFLALTSSPENLTEMAETLLSVASPEEKETIMYHYHFALTLAFRSGKALEVLERFVRDFPDSEKMPVMAYRYVQSTTQPNTAESAKALEDYLQKYPKSPLAGMVSIHLARYYASTDWELAKQYYKRAIETDSSEPRPYNSFAYDCATRETDLPEAEGAILKAIEIANHNYYRRRFFYLSFEERKEVMARDLGAFYDSYGWIKFKQEEYEDALPLIEKAVSLIGGENTDSEILQHLAEVCEKTDKLDEAVEIYLKILQKEPENEESKEKALRAFRKRGGSEEEFEAVLTAFSRIPKEERCPAPDFVVRNLADVQVTLADLKGKVVVVNFWATWCGPCSKEIPLLNHLTDSFEENSKVVFLAISSEKKKTLEAFTKSNQFNYGVCYEGSEASRAYKVMYIPTHVVIDTEGRIYSKHVGFKSGIDELLEKEIKKVLSESDG